MICVDITQTVQLGDKLAFEGEVMLVIVASVVALLGVRQQARQVAESAYVVELRRLAGGCGPCY